MDSQELRKTLASFPTGVCVVTFTPADQPKFGITINSFSSLSMEPPLILWSLQKSSETLAVVRASNDFVVNFLCNDQQDIATQYAKKGDHVLAEDHFIENAEGLAIIRNSLSHLVCRQYREHDAGDHIIFIGEVREVATDDSMRPLIFHNSEFHEMP